jgi:hypothetical protein
MFIFDLRDGFYALGINHADRSYFTVNVRGPLYILAGLPMGWSLSPFYFCKMTLTFVNFLRNPDPEEHIAPTNSCSKTYLKRTRSRGARILPYVDDFLLFASTEAEALTLMPPPGLAARSARSPPPPHQGFLGTGASRAPPEYRHQHNVMLLLCAGAKTNQDCTAYEIPHRQSHAERALVTRKKTYSSLHIKHNTFS